MRAARRHPRKIDPLATPEAIRPVCDHSRARLPYLIPASEKHLMRFLYAVRHLKRRPAMDTLRGHPSRWPRERLTEAAIVLRGLLSVKHRAESPSAASPAVPPLLRFPSDVTGAFDSGYINLQEVTRLARLTAERLGASPLRQYLAVQGGRVRRYR